MALFERFVAFRYLRAPRKEGFISVIAWFSLIGISLGVATLIIVMSVMNGFREELLKSIVGMRGHILVNGMPPMPEVQSQIIEDIKKNKNLAAVYPMVERQAIANHKNQARGVMVHALSYEDLEKRKSVFTAIKTEALQAFAEGSILVGKRMAEIMNLGEGDKILLISPEGNNTAFGSLPRQKAFTVGGIFEVGMNEFDKNIIFMPLAVAQDFFKMPGLFTHLEIFLSNISLSDEVVQNVQETLGPKANVVDWRHSDAGIFHAVQVERNVMFLILTLIILIASFNIISSLIMLVKDKTRDIAILRTMGASQKSVMKIFMITGSSIGVIGTLTGVTLGLTFALNIETIRQWLQKFTGSDLFSAEIYYLTQLPAKVDFSDAFIVALMALGLSFLATLYPAWKASKLDPVEALRFE